MSTTAIPVSHTRQDLQCQEDAVFHSIPGMDMLRHASTESIPALEEKYPDAAFALMIANNLFTDDPEQNEIHLRAYTSILKGDSFPDILFRFNYDLEA